VGLNAENEEQFERVRERLVAGKNEDMTYCKMWRDVKKKLKECLNV
jgi:hypothetical protein